MLDSNRVVPLNSTVLGALPKEQFSSSSVRAKYLPHTVHTAANNTNTQTAIPTPASNTQMMLGTTHVGDVSIPPATATQDHSHHPHPHHPLDTLSLTDSSVGLSTFYDLEYKPAMMAPGTRQRLQEASFGSSYGDLSHSSDPILNPPSQLPGQSYPLYSSDDDSSTAKSSTSIHRPPKQQPKQQPPQQQQQPPPPTPTTTNAITTTTTTTAAAPPVSLSALKDQLRAEKESRLAAEAVLKAKKDRLQAALAMPKSHLKKEIVDPRQLDEAGNR